MPSELLHPVLEFAVGEAKAASKSATAAAGLDRVPPTLEPFFRFRKLPSRAMSVVYDVIETDEAFRTWLAPRVIEARHGRVGVLFVQRPDRWREDLERLIGAWDEPALDIAADAKRLQRRLDVAERARERAETENAQLRLELDKLTGELSSAAARLDAIDSTRDDTSERLEALESERRRAVQELKATEQILARHLDEKRGLQAQLDAMTAAQLGSTTIGPDLDDATVRSLASSIGAALNAAAAEVEELRHRATPTRQKAPQRRPLPLPPGLLDDSDEVADYLLGVPGMRLLVDGYNVTKTVHDHLQLSDQRQWLNDGLRALCARRQSTSATIVWDGVDVGAVPGGGGPVDERFTAEGREADDELIDLVGRIERTTPVCVVSSDKRVRDGAMAGGANVLHSRQLISAMG